MYMKKTKKEKKPVDTSSVSGGAGHNSAERKPALTTPENYRPLHRDY